MGRAVAWSRHRHVPHFPLEAEFAVVGPLNPREKSESRVGASDRLKVTLRKGCSDIGPVELFRNNGGSPAFDNLRLGLGNWKIREPHIRAVPHIATNNIGDNEGISGADF